MGILPTTSPPAEPVVPSRSMGDHVMLRRLPNVAARRRAPAAQVSQWSIKRARHNPNAFVAYCCTDADARPLRQSNVHRQLQAFLTAHRKALIELPRDHGKSVQVCARVLWELGRNPALRVKIVCA